MRSWEYFMLPGSRSKGAARRSHLSMLILAGAVSLLTCTFGAPAAHGGSFRHIKVDGNFNDWNGVPVALDDDVDEDARFDFKDVFVANDEQFLYIRIRLHSEADYADFHHQVVVDGDGDAFTGLQWLGLGSEMLIEDGAGYQQKNGEFNEGGVSQLGWSAAPRGRVTEIEARFSRDTLDTDGDAVISGSEVALSFVARNLDWQIADSLEGLLYELAQSPDRFEGSATVIELSDAAWLYQDAGDPPGLWQVPDPSGQAGDWKSGAGMAGFGLPGGVYPEVTLPLAPGRTTYFLRTSFEWDFDTLGVALLADVHLSDGAVLYLNGVEARRTRMPEGAITPDTPATGNADAPGVVESLSLPSAALVTGVNYLAVEVHQAAASPAELAFGMGLRASDSNPPLQLDPSLPKDRTATEGEATLFTPGSLAGTEPFSFQWFKNGSPIEDATSPALEIPLVLVDDAGTYSVEISNATGSIRSRGAVLATSAVPVALTNPSLPADRAVTEGGSTTFAVDVAGSPLLAYQWHKDGEPIGGETGPTYTIDSARAEDAGAYHVTVTNRLNAVASRAAALVVLTDTTAPGLSTITGSSGRIVIRFSEPVDAATALSPASYALQGIEVTGAELSGDDQTVTLTTGKIPFGQAVAFRVAGVEDRFGNAAHFSAPFRSTILIDGGFDDWEGISPAASDPEETGENSEFKDFWIANDGEFLYLRFSFHGEIGPLPGSHYFQLYLDADNDPGTGFAVSGIGSTMMIENGLGWLQRDGGFNEGSVGNTGFLLAPQEPSPEFECRISLSSLVNADQSSIFTSDTVAVAFNLMSTSWTSIDSGPVEEIISHTLTEWLPATPPPSLAILSLSHDPETHTVELTWNASASGVYAIESSMNLVDWVEEDDGIAGDGEAEITATVSTPGDADVLYLRVLDTSGQ